MATKRRRWLTVTDTRPRVGHVVDGRYGTTILWRIRRIARTAFADEAGDIVRYPEVYRRRGSGVRDAGE